LACFGHEGLWVGAEDAGGGGVAVPRDGADVVAFVGVDGGEILTLGVRGLGGQGSVLWDKIHIVNY